jgi:hypothetical protein
MPEFVNFRSAPAASDPAPSVHRHRLTTHSANEFDPGRRKQSLENEIGRIANCYEGGQA